MADTLEDLDDAGSVFHFRRGTPSWRGERFTCDRPKRGRYVRVIMAKNESTGFLCFNEILVYGEEPLGFTTTEAPYTVVRGCGISSDTGTLGTNLAAGI